MTLGNVVCLEAILDPVPLQADDTLTDVVVWVGRGACDDHVTAADAVEARCDVLRQDHVLREDGRLHGWTAAHNKISDKLECAVSDTPILNHVPGHPQPPPKVAVQAPGAGGAAHGAGGGARGGGAGVWW